MCFLEKLNYRHLPQTNEYFLFFTLSRWLQPFQTYPQRPQENVPFFQWNLWATQEAPVGSGVQLRRNKHKYWVYKHGCSIGQLETSDGFATRTWEQCSIWDADVNTGASSYWFSTIGKTLASPNHFCFPCTCLALFMPISPAVALAPFSLRWEQTFL